MIQNRLIIQTQRAPKNEIDLNTNFAKTRPCKIQIGASNTSYDINFGNYINKANLHDLKVTKIMVKNTLPKSYQNNCYYRITYCTKNDFVDCKKMDGLLVPEEEKAFNIPGTKSLKAKNYTQRLECLPEKCGITIEGKNFSGCSGEVSTAYFKSETLQKMKIFNISKKDCACRVETFSKGEFEGLHGHFNIVSQRPTGNRTNQPIASEYQSTFPVKSIWYDCVQADPRKKDYFFNRPSF